MKTIQVPYLIETLWGYLGVQGDFMEPPRRELKIPLRVLCLLSDKIESRGPPGLRAKLTINSYLRRCVNVAGGDSLRRAGRATSLTEGGQKTGLL